MKIISTILLEDGNADVDFLIDALIEMKFQNLRKIKVQQKDENITICGY